MAINRDAENEIDSITDALSCYPEEERKPRESRKNELIEWYEKYGEVNKFYNIYGMDRCCSEPNDSWLDRGLFRKERHNINSRWIPKGSSFSYDYTLYMRDKLAFEYFMKGIFGNGKEYCRSEGILINKQLCINDHEKGFICVSYEDFCETFHGRKMIFKQSFGCSGDGIRIVEIRKDEIIENGISNIPQLFFKSISDKRVTWLIQDYILQHKVLMELNQTSVNTMRVVTFNTGVEVIVARNVLRFGKEGSFVDNADKGGFVTGVSMSGQLYQDYFDFSSFSRLSSPYKNIVLPYYKEAIEIVKKAHALIPELFSIGWDVAFGTDGPVIIEGNDGWDPHIAQAPLGNAMRNIWDSLLTERIKWEQG